MGRKYDDVEPEQGKVLEELEKLLGKEIKRQKKLLWDTSGYRSEERNVVELNLNSRALKKLPDIEELTSLTTLFLSNNELTSLPESFGKLSSLQRLVLSENNLDSLPKSFTNLSSLKELLINENRLTALPDDIGKLTLLEELNAEHNRLSSIPESIGRLTNLTTLDISHNQLKTLPESIGKLKSLQLLDVEKNKIEWLPESIGNLKAVEKLDASNNKLILLPGTIGDLRSLQTLDLRRNLFKTLPGSLWRLTNLRDVRISGNPLVQEWSPLKTRTTEEIQEFCRRVGSVNVFISHAVADYKTYQISEIADNLKSTDEINYVYHCMQDMKKEGQFDKFMNEKIPKCQILLFIATKKSLQSADCQHEIALAKTQNLKIIPILGNDLTWEDPDFKRSGITRELGLEFKEHDLKTLCKEIYDYIHQYKRKHEVFTREEAEIKSELNNIEHTLRNFFESEEFEKILKHNLSQFKELFQNLNQDKITPRKYLLQLTEILSPVKKEKPKEDTKPKTEKKPKADKTPITEKKPKAAKKSKEA